jgi:hypothetical protein
VTILAAAGDLGFIDLDQAGERRAAARHHAAAQLGADQPGRLVGAEGELALQLQGRDAVGMGSHQIGRPEPGGQRQLGVVHDGAGGNRGLSATAGAFPGPRLGVQFPGLALGAAGAHKALGPARCEQVSDTGRLIRQALLELDQGAGKGSGDWRRRAQPSRQNAGRRRHPGRGRRRWTRPHRSRRSVRHSAESLHPFIVQHLAPGATAKTDGWSAYPGAPGVSHDPHVIGKMAAHVVLPWVHRIFSNLKVWGLGVYHGLRRRHLQSYLDEFVFRFNRRRTRHAAFRSLLGVAAGHAPFPYKMLISPEVKA